MVSITALPMSAPRHKFTVEQYRSMLEQGLLPESGTELIEGEVVDKMTQGEAHSWCVTCLTERFVHDLTGRAVVRVQMPLTLDSFSFPEPDVLLVRGPRTRYRHTHPLAADVLLLVEVAEFSIGGDRNEKLKLYARNRIPDYWIVNIREAQIEVYRDPAGDSYTSMSIVPVGASASPLVFPDIAITAAELFA